jgi:hypothetical protein
MIFSHTHSSCQGASARIDIFQANAGKRIAEAIELKAAFCMF